ncbi:MAG: FAD:protein FMN transferase [Syntrophomonadaceae bacterium]|nr:FAD:protein FMN transferase [Syntrophomonadaceae bacterium]
MCSLIVLICVIFLTSCGPEKPYEANDFAMGTMITQEIYGDNSQSTAAEVIAKIQDLEALMTINAPRGDINKLNQNAGKGFVELNPETMLVLKSARKISELSGGAFDITIGPVVKSWGIGTEPPQIPTAASLKELVTLIDYTDVHLDQAGNMAALQRPGQIVDLGGIAKGYAGDSARTIYQQNGIKSALINLGGNVVAHGHKPDGNAWNIGIQNPRSPTGEIVGFVPVSDQAVVTSGDYQRYFEKEGKRYYHIMDPRTGFPAESGIMSVTVIAASSMEADGLSTACFVLGLDKGLELLQRYGPVEAIFITTDKKIYVTKGLQENFQLKDESNEYTVVKEG